MPLFRPKILSFNFGFCSTGTYLSVTVSFPNHAFHFLQKDLEKISVICVVTCKRNSFKSSS